MTTTTKITTKQHLMDELTRLRADYQGLRRQMKELGAKTSQLYRGIDQLRPEPSRLKLKGGVSHGR